MKEYEKNEFIKCAECDDIIESDDQGVVMEACYYDSDRDVYVHECGAGEYAVRQLVEDGILVFQYE